MKLDRNIKEKVNSLLKHWPEVYVISKRGVGLDVVVDKSCFGVESPDASLVATYKVDDVYTKEEQILNYIEVNLSYPNEYKGEKSSRTLEKIKDLSIKGEPFKLKFNSEGTAVIDTNSLIAIGNGSALTPYLGNTSWMINDYENPVLIDCGSTVFSELEKRDLLIDNLNVLITHLHADNVGSLATLIEHYHYVKKETISVYVPDALVEDMSQFLWIQGMKPKMYKLVGVSEDSLHKITNDVQIQPFETKHVYLDYFKTFGWKLIYNGKNIIYSGDWREIPADIAKEINSLKFDELYLDVSQREDNPTHISILKLTSLLDVEALAKMTPIHRDK